MVVKVGDWRLRSSEGFVKFDLHHLKEAQSGKVKGQMIDTPFAFGIGMTRAIEIIIQEEMKEKVGEIDLKNFIKEYKKVSAEVIKSAEKIEK